MSTQIKQKILNAVTRLTATFTAAATDIITSNAHGLSNGDRIELTTTDTLPAGLATDTIYYVMVINANTFKLSIDKTLDGTGTAVDITDTGTGTHTFTITDVGEPVLCMNYRHKQLVLSTTGMGAGDTITVKVQGSSEETPPDFHKAKSSTNEWDYIQLVDLEDGSTHDGDTGITFADSNDLRKFAVNDDGLFWVNVQITAQSDVSNTTITAELALRNDY